MIAAMTAFSTMIDALFSDNNIAMDVLYKVGGTGAGVSVRGILEKPQKDVSLGMLNVNVTARTLDVRSAEVATVTEGDTVVIDAVEYRVVSPELDGKGLVWTLALDNT